MLGHLHDAVKNHFISMFQMWNMGIPDHRVIHSPVDDRDAHYALLERTLNDIGEVLKYPFAVVARGEYPIQPALRMLGAKSDGFQTVMLPNKGIDANHTGVVRAAPINVMYYLSIYTDDPDYIDEFISKLLLSLDRSFLGFEYSPPELQGESIQCAMSFEGMDETRTSIIDRRNEGLKFSIKIPFQVESMITTEIDPNRKVILDTDSGFNLQIDVPQ